MIAAAWLAFLAGLGLSGCSSPTKTDDPVELPYPLRASPDSLIAQFVWAYENMDLEVYLDCLADSMLFYLSERDVENDPELEPGYWGKAVEQAIHESMFGDGPLSPSRIELRLTPVAIETLRALGGQGRPIGWRYREAVDLRIYIGVWTYWATMPSLFEIRLDPDDVGPSGEPLFEIVEWQELDDWLGRAGREQTSWGAIKALYLGRGVKPLPERD